MKNIYTFVSMVAIATVMSCSGSNKLPSKAESETGFVEQDTASWMPLSCNDDTIYGNYHLLQTGLLQIFSEIPSELGILMDGNEAKKGKTNGIFPAIFNASIPMDNFLKGDTLKFSWKSDTIIWRNSTSIEVITYIDEFCTIMSGIDAIKTDDILSAKPTKISHDISYSELNDKRIISTLKKWDEAAIDSLFLTSDKCHIFDGSVSTYGRIIIKNGKLTELKYINGIRDVKL
ncbi:MAG: hypothetical protein K2N28_05735 [Muribaculaceae bacterium]|nr:hypothetical protein [Muribaculaceae bacterium]